MKNPNLIGLGGNVPQDKKLCDMPTAGIQNGERQAFLLRPRIRTALWSGQGFALINPPKML